MLTADLSPSNSLNLHGYPPGLKNDSGRSPAPKEPTSSTKTKQQERDMARSRATAKAAGSSFERLIADGLMNALGNPDIDRAPRKGSKDVGDIANVRHANGERIAIEAKDYGGKLEPTTWTREATVEAVNYRALCGIVMAKRRGTTKFEDQWVLMTGADLISLLTGDRSEHVVNLILDAD